MTHNTEIYRNILTHSVKHDASLGFFHHITSRLTMAVSAAGMHMKSTIQLPSTFYAMTDPNGAAIYGVPWIPSIYPSHVSIYIYQHHGAYGL